MKRILAYNHPHVVFEDFGDEAVIIHLETGVYYNTEGPGRFIWELIGSRPCREDAVNRIRLLYDGNEEEIRRDVHRFIDELIAEDLVLDVEGDAAENESARPLSPEFPDGKKPYVRPLIKKYTDQKELLLLDPIHEVDDLGWPEKK
jgi:hypothetical protein